VTSSALEKRIKKHIHAKPHDLRIVPAPGWKDVCEDEVRFILKTFTQPGKFQAEIQEDPEGIGLTQLDFRQLIEIPQRLLTAQACLWTILDKHVGSFGELDQALANLDFALFLPEKCSVQLKVQSFQSHLYHEGKLHELISRIFAEQGLIVKDDAPWHLLAEQRGNRFKLFLALGPYPLHHRNYKAESRHGAPLQECLAASALRWMMNLQKDWRPDHIMVPFAGSGTLLFESWLLLGQTPAYFWNPQQYLEKLPATPRATLDSIRKRLNEHLCEFAPATLIEKDPEIAAALPAHVESFLKPLNMTPATDSLCADVFQSTLPAGAKILAPLNPPYGLRLAHEGKSRPMDFYRDLAGFLQKWPKKGQDLRGFMLIPDEDSLQVVRQRLGSDSVKAVQSFSQGGQHIRCLAFHLNGI
jgi:23S rRNA G2445 N2-methylase RlmL